MAYLPLASDRAHHKLPAVRSTVASLAGLDTASWVDRAAASWAVRAIASLAGQDTASWVDLAAASWVDRAAASSVDLAAS